jgi:uncharacterized integral membrane protein (TIGR00698 family)
MKYHVQRASGILLCFLLSSIAFGLGKQYPVIGGAVFGIVIGMITALWKRPVWFEPGIRFTSKKILQYSIILLGFEMDMASVLKVGAQSLYVIFFTLSASFITAFLVSKRLGIPVNIATLVGVGTSICGGSAIAATAPVIGAADEDISQSISTIFLFNILAVFLFPYLGSVLELSDAGFGMWAGTAINDTSSVVAAGAAWSQRVGNDAALHFATIVKLTRTLMIVPITLVLGIYTLRIGKRGVSNYSFVKIFPWFVLGFLMTALARTLFPIPVALTGRLVWTGKFMIIMAMTAIGLNTELKKLLKQGLKPVLLGACCWFSVAAVSLIVQSMTGNM